MSETPTKHDPYCPKSFPARVFTEAETGDPWAVAPVKFVCQCEQLAAARKAGNGGEELRLAYVRSRLDPAGIDGLGDTERIRDLSNVLALARRAMPDGAVWDWMSAPNTDLADATPLDLMASGQHQRVVALLTAAAEDPPS